MGQLPSAVTSAEPEWLPKRILAGRAAEDDAREARLYQTRRISEGLDIREIAWAPDGSFVAVVGKRASDAKPRVWKLALGSSFRPVEPEPVSIEGEAVSGVAVAEGPNGSSRILFSIGQKLVEIGPSGRKTIDTAPYAALNIAVQPGRAPAEADLFMVAKHPGGIGLVRALADGSKPRLLVNDHVEPGPPALSADASYVAVAGASDKGNDAAVLLTSTEGGQIRRLAPAGTFAPRAASFHPGGRLLAFASARDRKESELYLVQVADGGGVERVTFKQADTPAFSPDGRSIAFSSTRGKGAEVGDLYIARFLEEP
jgi:hypothetical protein